MKLFDNHINELITLCEKHMVDELYAFGSVLTDSFTNDSDVDLLVRFGRVDPQEYYDNFMDFKEALEKLFLRNVDLIEMQTLKNPILRQSIHRNKMALYERADSKMAV
jgi:predicted nucleotidyltransferase